MLGAVRMPSSSGATLRSWATSSSVLSFCVCVEVCGIGAGSEGGLKHWGYASSGCGGRAKAESRPPSGTLLQSQGTHRKAEGVPDGLGILVGDHVCHATQAGLQQAVAAQVVSRLQQG